MAARKKAARKTSRTRKAVSGTARAVKAAAAEAAWSNARPKTAAAKAARAGSAGNATAKRAVTKAVKPAGRKAVKKAARPDEPTPHRGDPALLGEVEALAELMDIHGLVEVSYELGPDGSKRIHVSRASIGYSSVPAPGVTGGPPAAGHAPSAPAHEPAAPVAPAEDLHVFTSPMVGTYYRSPSPEAPPFASVGDQVDGGTVVCIIEAMKVMNEISPDLAGEIVSIEVENGAAVEFGQPLMLIRPR